MPLKKELGQVWTPVYIVDEMLDEIGYVSTNTDILTQKIMEPSFGAGVFLYQILQRLIECAKNNAKNDKEIEEIIDANVYGIEYDKDVYDSTIDNVKSWLKTEYSLTVLFNNFYNMDALDYRIIDESQLFDFVVGNPPYIRVHDMPDDMRKKVKTYSYSTGNSDLYIIFFEIGLNMLRKDGQLAYITPNSWLRNSSQRLFRKNLMKNKEVKKIVNFNSDQVFEGVGTYTCISYLSKDNQELLYVDALKNLDVNYSRFVKYSDFSFSSDSVLVFSSVDDQMFLDNFLHDSGEKLDNLCKIQNGVLTLGNKYFILDEDTDNVLKDFGIEKHVYPSVKASVYKGEEITQRIIFPYSNVSGKFKGILEEELSHVPEIYEILLKNKEVLSERSLEKDSLWFWYRSQSLQETAKRKLVFSHIIGPLQEKINAYIVPENTVVYGGFFITEKETDLFSKSLSLEEIKEIIESESFLKYCRIVGKDMNGGYKTFSTTVMKKFVVNE